MNSANDISPYVHTRGPQNDLVPGRARARSFSCLEHKVVPRAVLWTPESEFAELEAAAAQGISRTDLKIKPTPQKPIGTEAVRFSKTV